jgi:hypothetical protein
MKMFARLALVAVMLASAAIPARADDKSDLQAKIAAAAKGVKSVVMTTVISQVGATTTVVYVAPDRTRSSISAPILGTRDVLTIGDTSYLSTNGGPYTKSESPGAAAQVRNLTDVTVIDIQPDITTAGITYGQYTTTITAMERSVSLICAYDKKTYLRTTCGNEFAVVKFTNYNDPKNIVEVPSGAK